MAYTYKYPRPAVTADCIVITREAEPKVLLIQRGNPPFKGAVRYQGTGGRDRATSIRYSSDWCILQG